MLTPKDIADISEPPLLGMSAKDINRYSLARVIRGLCDHRPVNDGIEGEMHQELKRRRIGNHSPEGSAIPFDIFQSSPRRNRAAGDLQVGVFGNGGALVPTDLEDPMIPLLKNKTSVIRLGATVVSGLTGMVTFPRQTSTTMPSAAQEIQLAGKSSPTIDQLPMGPKRVTVEMDYSKQLALQSAVSVENWLRGDMLENFGIVTDQMSLIGGGVNQPVGIMNTPGVGAVNFGGAVTWANVLAFEADLANQNAEFKGMLPGFVTTPNVRKAWKSTAIALTGAQTVSARPIWESILNDENGDGIVNGARAVATNQIQNDRVIYANWKELLIGFWGQGFDLTVDPYTRSKEAVISLVGNIFMDVALKHPQSFAVSIDAGDQ